MPASVPSAPAGRACEERTAVGGKGRSAQDRRPEPLAEVAAPAGPGRLSTMARPRGNDWLDDEMAALKDCGVDILVCALTGPELDELGLTDEPRAAAAAGLRFVATPIPDRTVPDLAAILPTLRGLAAQLRDGAHVVTHCRAGIGRSSLVAAAPRRAGRPALRAGPTGDVRAGRRPWRRSPDAPGRYCRA
ncbi:phosphatase domain-containing putative toxin [Kitasatospora indigofera]|uniref:phosphatase domain-containing putative toxin n=1 Tax=Kitasatospora indigofera TaxID=67307 RepID=UPI0033A5E99C